jgi:acyl-CoA thioesterase II
MNRSVILDAREMLSLQRQGENVFRAATNHDNSMGAVYGGQVVGQALMAALGTVEDMTLHAMSSYFLKAGKVEDPIEYTVEPLNDSRRFAARRVAAMQGDRRIFELTCSFHKDEVGLQHEYAEMGEPPAPEDLLNLEGFAKANAHRLSERQLQTFSKPDLMEMCLTNPDEFFEPADKAARDYWLRIPSAKEIDDLGQHRALLALLSDYWFPGAASSPHPREPKPMYLSLNHSVWFHAPVRVDEWVFYQTQSDWANHGRGLVQGKMFNREGRLLATVMQEALLRLPAA